MPQCGVPPPEGVLMQRRILAVGSLAVAKLSNALAAKRRLVFMAG